MRCSQMRSLLAWDSIDKLCRWVEEAGWGEVVGEEEGKVKAVKEVKEGERVRGNLGPTLSLL